MEEAIEKEVGIHPEAAPLAAGIARHVELLDKICSLLRIEARFAGGVSDDGFDEAAHLVLGRLKELTRGEAEAAMALNEWVLMKDDVPLPPYDIRSPVVSHLLSQWSKDETKTLYVVKWSECLSAELPEGFPRGLQLANCTSEMKDGFLLLLIPLIRHSSMHDLDVFCRRRIAVQQPQLQPQQHHQHHQPDFIFDLRIKVAGGSRSSSTSLGFPLWTSRDSTTSRDSSSSSSCSTLAADAPSSSLPAASLQQRLTPLASLFGLLSSPFRQQSSHGPAAGAEAEEAARAVAEVSKATEAAEEAAAEEAAKATEGAESDPNLEPAKSSVTDETVSTATLHVPPATPAPLDPAPPPAAPPSVEKTKKVDRVAERLQRLRAEGK